MPCGCLLPHAVQEDSCAPVPGCVKPCCSNCLLDGDQHPGFACSSAGCILYIPTPCAPTACVGRRDDANEALKAAQEAGNAEDIEKYAKRSIKVH
jgi:hypothetical protein